MKRSVTRLANGRELIYFDTESVDRDARDQRHLKPRSLTAEVRFDPLIESWVIIAPHRQQRTFDPDRAHCPLCPSQPDRLTEIPSSDYEVVAFENRFPSLASTASVFDTSGDIEISPTRPAIGRCEVLCFTPIHDASFSGLTSSRVQLVLEALIDRTQELSLLPGVEQVFCFENRGREIGVTLEHPHGQIYAYPYITPRTSRMISAATAHLQRTGRNLFDDVVAAEIADARRLVVSNSAWIAFVPHAARWPYEVHLYPLRRVADLSALRDDERALLAPIYLDLLQRFDRLFSTPAPYVSAWHQAPINAGRETFGLHLELFTVRRADDKLKFLAGSESGMDAFANDIAPESAAERLRNLAP